MHSNETKDQFVELRASGKSFGDIAEQLNVSKSTLHGWEDERADPLSGIGPTGADGQGAGSYRRWRRRGAGAFTPPSN